MFKFDLKANGTNFRTEALAGVTTFLSMVLSLLFVAKYVFL